jgi:hypothetical protein
MGAQAANDDVNVQRESRLDHALTFSFGKGAKDNRPRARTLTFGDLIQEFATPDTARGRLSAAEYHALDKSNPAEKAQRDREKEGAYFVACCFGGDGRRCNQSVMNGVRYSYLYICVVLSREFDHGRSDARRVFGCKQSNADARHSLRKVSVKYLVVQIWINNEKRRLCGRNYIP